MLNQGTRDILKDLRMPELISIIENQDAQLGFDAMSFHDRFTLIIKEYLSVKKVNRIKHLIKSAKLRFPSTLADISYLEGRNLNRQLIENLGTCNFILSYKGAIFYGPTGCGKTYLACAIGNSACRALYKVMYVKHDEIISSFLSSDVVGRRKLI